MRLLRALAFNAAFYVGTAVLAILCLPLLAARRGAARVVLRFWARGVILALRLFCGVRVEVSGIGNIPPGAAVLVSKHQSAFDTIVWLSLLPDAAYVMKRELLAIPLYGWYARKAEMIPVDREGGGAALRRMMRAAQAALSEGRQVVIFPEGTRTAPDERARYQPGVVAIAATAQAPIIPVATDSGRVWPRDPLRKRPGVIRVSVLPPLPPDLPRESLLATLEALIEAESARLLEHLPSGGEPPSGRPCSGKQGR